MVQMPCLSNDILYIISEKLLFQRDNLFGQNDLRIPNAYTLFMYHSARNMCAFISHFSKMKRLDLSSYGGERCISFYKDEILPLEQTYNNKFAGPYFVNKKMFSDLLDAGLLHISFIQIKNFLGELSKTDFSATDNNNILKYLINIKECIHNSSSPVSSNLNILNLSVDEPAAIIKKHLITLISTNIENMEFCCSEEGLFECDPETFELALLERPSISMTRIKKIATKCTIEIKSTTNFLKNLMNYLQFLLLSCPNIEFVEFVFTCHSELNTNFFNDDDYIPSDDDSIPSNSILPEEFITYLEFFVNSIIEHLKALNIGNKNLKTKIEFTSTFDDDTFEAIPSGHKLFALGKPFEIKKAGNIIDDVATIDFDNSPPYIARIIEIIDSMGRQHEFLFKIISEEPDDMDYYNDDDDNYDYYGGYDSDDYGSVSGFLFNHFI